MAQNIRNQTKIMINKKLIAVILLSLLIGACNPDRVFHETHTFPDYHWKKKERVIFTPEITESDAESSFKLILNIRYIEGFPYKYLRLKLNISRPDGTEADKDINIQIINDDKSYIGEGIGDYWDLDYADDEAIPFKGVGKFEIEIIPLMDQDPVYLINEIGISLIKTTN